MICNDLEERPISDEGPFLKEEGALLHEIARRLGRVIERKRAEELLRTANDELEKRVQARTVHLVAANEAQQVALRDLKWAQDHLREQRAQLAGIIASAMEAIVTVDEDGLVIVFNQDAERNFRLPAAEALGRSVERFIPNRFRALHPADRGLLAQGSATGYRIGLDRPAYALRADGEEFPIEAVISYVEVRGETLHTIILRDISERLKTEDTLRKLSLAGERTTETVNIL